MEFQAVSMRGHETPPKELHEFMMRNSGPASSDVRPKPEMQMFGLLLQPQTSHAKL